MSTSDPAMVGGEPSSGVTQREPELAGSNASVCTLERALTLSFADANTLAVLSLSDDGEVLTPIGLASVQASHASPGILIGPDGFPPREHDHPLARINRAEPVERAVYQFVERDSTRVVEITCRSIAGKRVVVASDITSTSRAMTMLQASADSDPLTGALNRRGLYARIETALTDVIATNDRIAVLAISIDGYRSFTHTTTDDIETLMLREIASRLRTATRDDEAVAYLGGDRFAILMNHFSNPQDAIAAAERIRREVNRPMKFGRRDLRVSVSIGIALNGRRTEDAEQFMANAHAAAHAARLQGENDWALFDDALRGRTLNEIRAEATVEEVLRRDLIGVDFQPVVAASNFGVVGFEAFARNRWAESTPMTTAAFVEAAERARLATPLDRRVLDITCDQMKRFSTYGKPLRVAVNISTQTALRPDLYALVIETLEEYQISPKSLILEVSEETLLHAGTAAQAAFAELHEDGVVLALDYYGNGKAGVGYATNFPITCLKLHPGFVQGVTTSATDRAVVRATIAHAHACGFTVTAVGVESAPQAGLLADLGADQLQGYHFARPMSGVDAEHFLAEH